MTRITNTILFPSIPNPQYKVYLNGRLTITLITPNRPSRCVSWNYNLIDLIDYSFLPNSLVSILTNFRITSADGKYIPMFSES